MSLPGPFLWCQSTVTQVVTQKKTPSLTTRKWCPGLLPFSPWNGCQGSVRLPGSCGVWPYGREIPSRCIEVRRRPLRRVFRRDSRSKTRDGSTREDIANDERSEKKTTDLTEDFGAGMPHSPCRSRWARADWNPFCSWTSAINKWWGIQDEICVHACMHPWRHSRHCKSHKIGNDHTWARQISRGVKISRLRAQIFEKCP